MPVIHYHIYECEDCIVNFAVEQTYEDQSDIKCPVCASDEYLSDVGAGSMAVIPEKEQRERERVEQITIFDLLKEV